MSLPRLNRRLALESAVSKPDGAGGFSTVWRRLGTLHAEVSPGTGRELQRGETSLSRVPLRIVVRASPVGSNARPKAGQRFVEGTRRFAIAAVTERDPTGAYLICYAQEEIVT